MLSLPLRLALRRRRPLRREHRHCRWDRRALKDEARELFDASTLEEGWRAMANAGRACFVAASDRH